MNSSLRDENDRRRAGLFLFLFFAAGGALTCVPEPATDPGTPGSGGSGTGNTSGTGGSSGGASGGSSGSGGGSDASGGRMVQPGTGGAGTGGAGTGGMSTGSGGMSTGGMSSGGRGGAGASGGQSGTGGMVGSGGSGRGGTTGSGGAIGTGGNVGGSVGTVKFLPNIRLNDDTGSAAQMETSIAAGPNGTVLASWVDYRSGLSCGYSFSTDGGATFNKNFLIKPSNGNITGDGTTAIDGNGTMYAVCQDYGISQIRLSTSSDKGVTWSAPASVQSSPDKPWIGASGMNPGTIFITWLGNAAGVRRSTDGGKNWGQVHALEFLNHGTALMVGNSGVVHIPFSPNGGDIRYARSKDLGDTWQATKTIGQTGTFCWSNCGSRQHPIIGGGADSTGKYAAVVWAATYTGGEGDEDIWVIYTSDSGDTWTKPIKVNDNKTKSRQWQPWVGVDNRGRMHVVWSDLRNGKMDTYYARSLSTPGMGFEANVQVNDKSGSVAGDILDYKGLAVYENDVFVTFEDTRNGNTDIYFAKAPGAAGP